MNRRIRRGLRPEPSLEGGLRACCGNGGEGGIAPVIVSYLCRVGGAGAANQGRSERFAAGATVGAGAGAGGGGGGCVPWAVGEGLTRGLKDALCPPLVFSMAKD